MNDLEPMLTRLKLTAILSATGSSRDGAAGGPVVAHWRTWHQKHLPSAEMLTLAFRPAILRADFLAVSYPVESAARNWNRRLRSQYGAPDVFLGRLAISRSASQIPPSVPTFLALPLRTQRLSLRPLGLDDASALFTIYSDPNAMRYWGTPAWTQTEQAADMIKRDTKALEAGEHLRLGIESQVDRQLIGACTLFSFHESSRRAEVGYILAPQCWGQGLMAESLDALITYGFTELNLNRIEADIDPRNQRSEKVLLRLGFIKEGLLRQRWIVSGESSDTALFGLLRSDWDSHRGSV